MAQDFWDGSEYVYWCLADRARTSAFRDSIRSVVRPGDTVVDVGAGSGVLGLTAALHGAAKVYLVESEPVLAKALLETVNRGGFSSIVEVLHQDALAVQFESTIDVVLCEMIGTGLISELQGPAVNHMLQFCNASSRLVPASYACHADLVWKAPPVHDLEFFMASYDYGEGHPFEGDSESLTDTVTFQHFDFSTPVATSVHAKFDLIATNRGTINGLRISGTTNLPGVGDLGHTTSYSMPVIFPLPRTAVSMGDVFHVELSYRVGGGLPGLQFQIDRVNA